MTPVSVASLITRIAPTPSGYLHVGNGLSFVLTWVLARANGGQVLLRIDDLDRQRYRPEYVEDIFETLDWLGLDYDFGPNGPDDFEANYSQLHRLDFYRELLGKVREEGVVYACTCSRKRIRMAAIDARLYDGHCRSSNIPLEGEGVAWRMLLPSQTQVTFKEWPENSLQTKDLKKGMGDFVIRKKDGFPAYQLASLADDFHWNINFVVRGEDLLWSTAAQYWLAELLKIENFTQAVFWHHPLIMDDRGEKLAKSKDANALRSWREAGKGPTEVYRLAAQVLDLPTEAGDSLSTLSQQLKNSLLQDKIKPS